MNLTFHKAPPKMTDSSKREKKNKENNHRLTGHLIECEKKLENYADKFSNIMRKKVAIMRKRRQFMQKFPKLIKLSPLFL